MPKLLPHLLLPIVAAVAFGAWLARESPRLLTYAVPMRDETFTTSPYGLLCAIGLALALALTRWRPSWSLALIGLVLAAQLFFWPARFSQTAWTAYLMLLPVAYVVAGRVGERRRALLCALLTGALVVVALLTVPALSFSGVEGTIHGKSWSSVEAAQNMAWWSALALAATVALWRAGSRRQRNTSAAQPAAPAVPDESLEGLSAREREVFRLVARGLSNSAVAAQLVVSEATVKSHLSSALAKLGLSSRSELIVYAYERGVIRPGAI
ncbi:response regulator transcription factor [Microbacterium sp. BG28]|uniref:response regulator transcription factor n=1 Tax=Microbacterium sp. BG28 TaxID=3097356 RepID=UPI002A5A0DE8|nr:response regulator transcription factor [Microbacterium sp. BG28]MDY0827845.1 response regulator transcription factor [Microbacterium sp. BG28]